MAKRSDERAEKAAVTSGRQADEVERLPFDLSVIEGEGVFVNVDAQGFGILDRKLDWATVGVKLGKSTVAFRAPSAGLLPDVHRLALLRPADQAHAALRKYSYHFSLTETVFESPAYRWIPWRAFEEFEHEFVSAQNALNVAREEVRDKWYQIEQEVQATYHRLAEDSERRLRSTGADVPSNFPDLVVLQVLKAMPKPEDLESKMALRYRVGVMMLGSEMLREQREAVQERAQIAVHRATQSEAEAQISVQKEVAWAQARVEQAELFAKEERIAQEAYLAKQEAMKEALMKDRLRDLKMAAAKERLHEALNPMVEGAQQLHVAIYDAAVSIKDALAKNEHLPSASAKRAREIAKWYRLMNWQSSSDLDVLIGELEALASRPPTRHKRDPKPLDDVLSSIISKCSADARAFGQANRLGAIEL